MSYIFKKGATSQSIELYIIDSTDGTPETGVLWNTAGIDLKYRRKDAAVVSITEAALTSPALTDTWETGGFLEIGNGVYRLDLPDAALASASGIDRVVVFGTVTGMVVLPVTIHLTDFDLNSATPDINVKTITAGIIANASFNADVGSTAHGTNIIALAVRKILEELNLDHLLKVTTGVDADNDLEAFVVAKTVMAHLMSTGADVTTFKPSTDSLQSIRDVEPHGSAMVGTNSAALASVVGALADAAADGAVTEADTLMKYIKQLINILIGAPGIVAFPAEAAPANGVSLAEVIRAIHTDTATTLKGIVDAIKVVTDNQAAASTTLITGTVSHDNEVATTTVIYSDDVTEATADHYNGRLFVPTSGALVGQYTDITDYELENSEGKFTVTALTEAPADDTTFVII